MEFRKTLYEDIDFVMKIINQAKDYFKENKINQWQDGYPNEDVIKNDIDKGCSYVILDDKKIIATAFLSFDKEKTYEKIYEGNWITNLDYATIHRIAVDKNYKGREVSKFIIEEIENKCFDKNIKSIRVDTHIDNESMKKMLHKNGFEYCGKIFLENLDERIAFEKKL
jgi:RimJ/RimL family protein N-acetyltransferase